VALESSGTMSIGGSTSGRSINLELGRSATATSSLNESDLRSLAEVSSGAISISDFYGKSSSDTFAVLSSADADTKDNYVPSLSNGNLTASAGGSSIWHHGRATLGFTTGKWYWEITPNGNAMVGVEPTSEDIDRTYFNEGTTAGLATRDGKIWFAGSQVSSGNGDWSDGDTIGFAFNANTGHMYIYINGSLSYDYDSTMSSSAFKKPAYSVYGSWTLTFNFGESGFDETPPTGYNAVSVNNGATTS